MEVIARNVSFATVECLSAILERGSEVVVRGSRTRELTHHVTVLERPLERFVFVPNRGNDPFAQMAEAVWVLAGRDDVDWLRRYLPRALDFSDDGSTWRGGYGPRLRRWHGVVDQLDQVRRLLVSDRASRRAVTALFDPEIDFVATLDVPCNNWLSWLIRDGRLHLAIGIRSNDAIWGFSGANAFEWSLVHDAMARWTGTEVGRQTWLATSFHVYDRHWDRARQIVEGFHGLSPYDFGVRPARFRSDWNDLERVLIDWFEAEEQVRADPDAPVRPGPSTIDPFLGGCLAAIRVRWGAGAWSVERTRRELSALPATDVSASCWEHLGRRRPELLADMPTSNFASFLKAVRGSHGVDETGFKEAIKRLHARKDRAYGAAWKRRGEVVSVLPNVARKVDRLEVVAGEGFLGGDEAILDTAIDLYVDATKYRLLLDERTGVSDLLPSGAPMPFSDHEANFDHVVEMERFLNDAACLPEIIASAVDIFERLWPLAAESDNLSEVTSLVDDLRATACGVIASVAGSDRRAAIDFVAAETTAREGG